MKVRKIVAGLAAMSMMATFSAQAVFAAASVSIKAGTATAAAGEKATVAISMEGASASTPVNALEFQINYDSKALKLEGVEAGAVIPTGTDGAEKFEGVNAFDVTIDAAGSAVVSYSTGLSDAAYCVTADGVVANVTFTVLDGTAAGKYDVSIVPAERETFEGSKVMNSEITAAYIKAEGDPDVYTATGTAGYVEVTAGGATPSEVKYGDVDCNGEVDILDVIALNQYLAAVGVFEDPAKSEANSDVNRDGVVDDSDAMNILKSLVKLTTLPVA